MRSEPLKAVHVACNNDGDEYYGIGQGDVTAIEWGELPGLHCMLDTVKVYRSGALHSEHPFHNCLGVYFAQPPEAT
jgi:hypothetical protein